MTTYRIWCEVKGGVTGHRVAWLKQSGKIAEFDLREDALTEARLLSARANGNPHRKADFSYTVKEYDKWK